MFKFIIILVTVRKACSLTCKEVLDFPKNRRIQLFELESLKPKEVVDCISHLGQIRLNISEAKFIWDSIISFYKDISNIPDEVLSSLNWVTIAVKPEHYQNLTLSNIHVISNFGLDYDLSKDQLLAIADRVHEDFGAKQPEDYTFYDLKAIRQILCVFEGSEIKRIQPKAYKEAALIIGQLKNCNDDVLESFSSLATDKEAFGSPNTWKRETICILGNVVRYLSEQCISLLKKKFGSDCFKDPDNNTTKECE